MSQAATAPSRPGVLNLSGPYAVGKDTAIDAIVRHFEGKVSRVSTWTTRPVDRSADPSYHHVDEAEMAAMASQSDEWIVNRQFDLSVAYATSIREIRGIVEARSIAVHNIFAGDAGAGELRRKFGPSLLSVGLLPPGDSLDEQLGVLRNRIERRARGSQQDQALRMKFQRQQLNYVHKNPWVGPDVRVFDYVVRNTEMSLTMENLKDAILRRFWD